MCTKILLTARGRAREPPATRRDRRTRVATARARARQAIDPAGGECCAERAGQQRWQRCAERGWPAERGICSLARLVLGWLTSS